jgi:hypothetical protein
MPSLLENSPYAVAECIEHGIPFLAADVGGTPELVAEEDRARVLHPPTADAFAAALEDALESGLAPARPAVAPEESLASWLNVVETVTPRATRPSSTTNEWVRVGDPDDALVESLADAAGDADVVTCAVRAPDGRQLYLGDPGPLGVVENQYGVVGIVRSDTAARVAPDESPWVFFARLAAAGARILSLPDALTSRTPDQPTNPERLAVLEAFEQATPDSLRQFPHLAATLAASLERTDGVPEQPSLQQRVRRKLLG